MLKHAERLERLKTRINALDWHQNPSDIDEFIRFNKSRFSIQVAAIGLRHDDADFSLDKACNSVIDFFTTRGFPKPARKAAKKIVTDVFQKLSPEDFNAFCTVMHERGQLSSLIKNSQSHMPDHVHEKLERWYKSNVREKLAIPAAYHDIKIIEVDGLLPEGETNPLGVFAQARSAVAPAYAVAPDQQRVEWIFEELTEAGYTKDNIRIFRDKNADIRSHGGNPYIVIDVKHADQHFQIAVCEAVGNATYVLRKPVDFENNPTVAISDLKKDDTVWQFSCYDREQYQKDISYLTQTPFGKLGVQLKTRLAWHDKKDALLESLKTYFIEKGEVPDKESHEIIRHGPLAGIATWSRAYDALRRGSVKGLEAYHNLKDALIHAMPEAAYALEPAKPIDAKKAFEDAVMYAYHHNALPPVDPATEAAFRQKKVLGLDEVAGSDEITSSRAFYKATGIAYEQDGELMLAPSPVIRQMARLIEEPKPSHG